MTPNEAMRFISKIERQFGWTVKVITREDVENIIRHPLTDQQWEDLTRSDQWQRLSWGDRKEKSEIKELVLSVVGPTKVA